MYLCRYLDTAQTLWHRLIYAQDFRLDYNHWFDCSRIVCLDIPDINTCGSRGECPSTVTRSVLCKDCEMDTGVERCNFLMLVGVSVPCWLYIDSHRRTAVQTKLEGARGARTVSKTQ